MKPKNAGELVGMIIVFTLLFIAVLWSVAIAWRIFVWII